MTLYLKNESVLERKWIAFVVFQNKMRVNQTHHYFFKEKKNSEQHNDFRPTKEKARSKVIINYVKGLGRFCFGNRGTLQKRLLFATKLFRRPQNAIGKTSFFDGKSLSSTITRQILKHL